MTTMASTATPHPAVALQPWLEVVYMSIPHSPRRSATGGGPTAIDGYSIRIDGGTFQQIAANDTIVVAQLPVGNHVVEIGERIFA